MRQLIIYTGLACFVAAAFAANLPNSVLFAPSGKARKSQVISEFINLSAAPSELRIDFLNRQRLQRMNHETRLAHIQPGLIAQTALATDLTVEEVRIQLSNPDVTSAFDHTGVMFDPPNNFISGQTGPWTWALVTQRAEDAVDRTDCGLTAHCGVWLLYWTQDQWFYSPVGHPDLNAILVSGAPELEPVIRDELEGY